MEIFGLEQHMLPREPEPEPAQRFNIVDEVDALNALDNGDFNIGRGIENPILDALDREEAAGFIDEILQQYRRQQ